MHKHRMLEALAEVDARDEGASNAFYARLIMEQLQLTENIRRLRAIASYS